MNTFTLPVLHEVAELRRSRSNRTASLLECCTQRSSLDQRSEGTRIHASTGCAGNRSACVRSHARPPHVLSMPRAVAASVARRRLRQKHWLKPTRGWFYARSDPPKALDRPGTLLRLSVSPELASGNQASSMGSLEHLAIALAVLIASGTWSHAEAAAMPDQQGGC